MTSSLAIVLSVFGKLHQYPKQSKLSNLTSLTLHKHFVSCNHNAVLRNNLIETTWEHTGCVVVLNVVGRSMMSYLKFGVVMAEE